MAELHEAIAGICIVIQQLICSYEIVRDPGNLDFLIYQVSKLLRILVAVGYCSTQVLDAVGQSLALLEGIQSPCHLTSVEGYVPELEIGNCRGRPRLNISKEQIEYLLDIGFSCPSK